jgi:general secretion pathway protein G
MFKKTQVNSCAKQQQSESPESGYTLLELLVVLGIIAALTALVAPQVLRYLGDAKSDTARVQSRNLQSALELHYLDTGQYPSTEQGLAALVTDSKTVKGWRGPYIKKADGLKDPWGRAYLYKSPGDHGAFDIYSHGKDGQSGGQNEDADIQNW